MLNKRNRLRSSEVAEIIAKGRSVRSTHLQVKFLPGSAPLRSAAVASKALAKKAVARNTLRRALYRALSASKTSHIQARAVFFVRVLPKAKLTATFLEELSSLLSKLN